MWENYKIKKKNPMKKAKEAKVQVQAQALIERAVSTRTKVKKGKIMWYFYSLLLCKILEGYKV